MDSDKRRPQALHHVIVLGLQADKSGERALFDLDLLATRIYSVVQVRHFCQVAGRVPRRYEELASIDGQDRASQVSILLGRSPTAFFSGYFFAKIDELVEVGKLSPRFGVPDCR
jgi:hypothetical protein